MVFGMLHTHFGMLDMRDGSGTTIGSDEYQVG
jgi:hypothetical protein